MNSSGAVYARFPEGGVAALDEAITTARAAGRQCSPLKVLGGDPARHAFAVVDRWGGSDNLPMWAEGPDLACASELAALSRLVGEVAAFYLIDDGRTMGVYGVWKAGTLVRDLQWLDGRWAAVAGEPQVWEQPLFTPESLERNLEAARWDEVDEAEVRAIFAAGQITVGTAFPKPDPLVDHFLAACPGPRYGFSPWPPRRTLVEEIGPPRRLQRTP